MDDPQEEQLAHTEGTHSFLVEFWVNRNTEARSSNGYSGVQYSEQFVGGVKVVVSGVVEQLKKQKACAGSAPCAPFILEVAIEVSILRLRKFCTDGKAKLKSNTEECQERRLDCAVREEFDR